MKIPSGPERQRALLIVGLLCELRHRNELSEEEMAAKLGFGSAEALHVQLGSWGIPEWLAGPSPLTRRPTSEGDSASVPPAALEETRKMAEHELRNLQHRAEHLAQLERDRDSLLESYAGLMPEAIDALRSEERYQTYRIIGLEVHLAPDGSFELSGDVVSFSKMEISSA